MYASRVGPRLAVAVLAASPWPTQTERPTPRHGTAPRCHPPGPGVDDTAPAPAAGAYRLTVVPTWRGARAGPAVTGRLWLWPAAPGDSSPHTGERAVARGPGEVAYTGATDAPLSRAGVALDRGDARRFPPPTSRDPVYPGLVVERPHGVFDAYTLWVGAANRRAPLAVMVRDGPGAIFFVQAGDGRGGFAGTWGPAGRVGGAGYFCARYAGPAPAR